jgi:hypothetical protein
MAVDVEQHSAAREFRDGMLIPNLVEKRGRHVPLFYVFRLRMFCLTRLKWASDRKPS